MIDCVSHPSKPLCRRWEKKQIKSTVPKALEAAPKRRDRSSRSYPFENGLSLRGGADIDPRMPESVQKSVAVSAESMSNDAASLAPVDDGAGRPAQDNTSTGVDQGKRRHWFAKTFSEVLSALPTRRQISASTSKSSAKFRRNSQGRGDNRREEAKRSSRASQKDIDDATGKGNTKLNVLPLDSKPNVDERDHKPRRGNEHKWTGNASLHLTRKHKSSAKLINKPAIKASAVATHRASSPDSSSSTPQEQAQKTKRSVDFSRGYQHTGTISISKALNGALDSHKQQNSPQSIIKRSLGNGWLSGSSSQKSTTPGSSDKLNVSKINEKRDVTITSSGRKVTILSLERPRSSLSRHSLSAISKLRHVGNMAMNGDHHKGKQPAVDMEGREALFNTAFEVHELIPDFTLGRFERAFEKVDKQWAAARNGDHDFQHDFTSRYNGSSVSALQNGNDGNKVSSALPNNVDHVYQWQEQQERRAEQLPKQQQTGIGSAVLLEGSEPMSPTTVQFPSGRPRQNPSSLEQPFSHNSVPHAQHTRTESSTSQASVHLPGLGDPLAIKHQEETQVPLINMQSVEYRQWRLEYERNKSRLHPQGPPPGLPRPTAAYNPNTYPMNVPAKQRSLSRLPPGFFSTNGTRARPSKVNQGHDHNNRYQHHHQADSVLSSPNHPLQQPRAEVFDQATIDTIDERYRAAQLRGGFVADIHSCKSDDPTN